MIYNNIQGLSAIQIDGLRFQYDGDGVRTPADFYTSNVSVDVKIEGVPARGAPVFKSYVSGPADAGRCLGSTRCA